MTNFSANFSELYNEFERMEQIFFGLTIDLRIDFKAQRSVNFYDWVLLQMLKIISVFVEERVASEEL